MIKQAVMKIILFPRKLLVFYFGGQQRSVERDGRKTVEDAYNSYSEHFQVLSCFASLLYELTHTEIVAILTLLGLYLQETKASVFPSKNFFLKFWVLL